MIVLLFSLLSYSVLLTKSEKTHYCSGNFRGQPYCAYMEGDDGTRFVLSVPHNGDIIPDEIPKRSDGCLLENGLCDYSHDCGTPDPKSCGYVVQNGDYRTKEIGEEIVKMIEKTTKLRPHLVINLLHRSRLDVNRFINQGTNMNPASRKAFNEYHDFIRDATNMIKGPALHIDLHGQKHEEEWIEIGYGITRDQLNDNRAISELSSLKNLMKHTNYTFEQIIRGNKSLGLLLQNQGLKVVPSPKYPSPGKGSYYSGGIDIRVDGLYDDGNTDSVQIELPKNLRKKEKVISIAKSLAKAINQWMDWHYP